jgi:hypothetical protein
MSPDEQSWQAGNHSAWTQMLRQCVAALDEDGLVQAGWLVERQEAVAALREICSRFGDNDWNEKLSLAEVIQNHLARHLASPPSDGTLVRVSWSDLPKGK